jgi:hypothetical protein
VLGFGFVVIRQGDANASYDRRSPLAEWDASIGGKGWIDRLVAAGKAIDLGGDGYPLRYAIAAVTLIGALRHGPPKHSGPPVVGDDYVLPAGWVGNFKINAEALNALDPGEILLVEAWDLS